MTIEATDAPGVTFEELLEHLRDLERLTRDECFVLMADVLHRTHLAISMNAARFDQRAASSREVVHIAPSDVGDLDLQSLTDENTPKNG